MTFVGQSVQREVLREWKLFIAKCTDRDRTLYNL